MTKKNRGIENIMNKHDIITDIFIFEAIKEHCNKK